MDGDGEGTIAIIQALRDAGLAITVMDGRYQRLLNLEHQARERLAIARILALKKSLEVSQFHSSAETSTLDKPHRGTQVCNGRYTSSYQTTHCNTSPASPQVDPPEFPPQRLSPNTTEGNFLVGGCRSGDSYAPVKDSRSYRKSIASQDRGALHSNRIAHTSEFTNRVSRESEAFIYSLRKYPSISPERPGSAEMVQRLINYTQSKNFKKRWRKSKSMRSLPDINRKPDIQTMNKSNKNIQTYTRSGSSSPVKNDFNANYIEETLSRNFILKSPISDSRNVRYKDLQDDHLNETYDYLKYNIPSHRKFYRSPEVRYLTDVTKRFRDTLRQIYDDKPIMCQKMRNRYTNHERQYHSQQQRQPCDYHRPILTPGCSKNCQLPYDCKPKTSFVICACPKKIIDDAINEWMKTIPINSAESRSDKMKREELIQKLALKLKEIVEDDDFSDKAKDEIEKCVNDMPMWNPGTEREQDALKNLIIESLYSKIKNLNNNDLLREIVSKWLDVVNLRDKDYEGNVVVKRKVVDDLVNKIKPLNIKDNGKAKVFKVVKKEIEDSVDRLPILLRRTRSETVNGIATKLTDVLENEQKQKDVENESSKTRIGDDGKRKEDDLNNVRVSAAEKGEQVEINNTKIKEEINEAISAEVKKLVENWSTDVSNLQSSIEKNRANEELAKQLLEIKTSNRNIEDTINRMQTTFPSESLNTIAAKIAEILVKEHEQMRRVEQSNRTRFIEDVDKVVCDEVKKLIKDWGQRMTNLQSSIDKNEAIEHLTQQLLEIKTTNIRIEDMISHIRNIDPNETVDAVVEKLMEILAEEEEKRKLEDINRERVKDERNRSFCEDVKTIIEEWGSKITKLQSSVDKNEAIDKLTEQLLDIKSSNMNLKDMINHMQNMIPNETVDAVVEKLTTIFYKEEEKRKREELNGDRLKEDMNKTVFREVKKLIEDWGRRITTLQTSLDRSNAIEDLTKQLLQIKSTNMNIEDMINRIQNVIPSETIEGVTVKLTEALAKEERLKRTEEELNKTRIKANIDKAVCAEVKKLVNNWENKISNMHNEIDKSKAIEELTNQIIELKLSSKNIENMINRMQNIIPSETVEGVTAKISEVLIKEQESKRKEEERNKHKIKNEVDKAVCTEIKVLMDDWNSNIANLQTSIQRNPTIEKLSKQLLEIKSTNTNIEDMINQMQHVISRETVAGVSSKLAEVLADDKKERQREKETLTTKFANVINKAVGTEIKALIEDCSKNIATLRKSIDKNSANNELAKQLLEIKSTNINIENLIHQMKSDIPTDTIEGVTEKLSKVIGKEQEHKRKEDEYNNAKLKTDIEKVVSAELKKLVHEWKDNIVNLQSIIGKNVEAEKLMTQLSEIKSKNANIEDMIHQLKYMIPSETVEGITAKLSEILINEQRQSRIQEDSKRSRTENDIENAVNKEVTKLIIDWNNDIANLQSSIDRNRTESLTRQLIEIKSTNMNIKDTLNEMQDTIKKFLETANLQQSDGRAKHEISTKLITKIQNLETLLGEKLKILSEQDHFSLGNEQDTYSQLTVTPTIVRQTSPELLRDSYERNRSSESPATSKSETTNIPKKKMRRMDAMEDVEISHSQNITPKQRLRNYYKDRHSLTDPIEHIVISDVKIGVDDKNDIEKLLKHIQELEIQGFDQDIILDVIDDWLDMLSKKTDIDIPIREREAIAKKLLEYFEKTKPRKRWDESNDKRKTFVNDISDLIDNELVKFGENRKMKNKTVSILESSTHEMGKVPSGDLKEFIREELKEMLEQYKVGITNKELEDMISHMLADQIMRGVDSDKSRGKVYSMLQEDNIPKSKAADISMKLTDRVREMSLAHKAKDSSIFINRSKKVQTVSPFHNEAFKNEAERIILEFIDEFTNDPNFVKQTKIKEHTRVLANLIADIFSEPNENTEDLLKDAIWEYFNEISYQSDTPVLDLIDELANRVLSIPINTSTPRKEKRSIRSKQDGIELLKGDKLKSVRTDIANTSKRFNDEININSKDLCFCDVEKLEIDYNDKLTNIISNWIEGFPIKIDEKFKIEMTKDLVSDILDRQKYLQLNPTTKTSDREELEHLNYQVFRWLNNLPGAGNKIAEETFDSILEEWFANLSLKSRKTCFEIIEVGRFKADFKCRLEHLHRALNKEAMRVEIRKFLLNFPLDPAKNNDEYINEKINELMELLESVPWVSDSGMYGDSAKLVHLKDSREINRTSVEDLSSSKQVNLSLQSIRPPSSFRKSCNILSDYIMVWFNSLPIITDSSEQGEDMKALKQSLASQLMNKIGEMNINQDIFNDDYLYEEILKDEIESLLNELPMNAELESTLSDLKVDLIDKIMDSRERIKQEIAGQQYKRNLRDIISKTLPLQRSMNLQDLAELDILKDHLADAYINLHFYGADNGLLDKYKTKISDEITRFCNNYLNKHPDASVDNEKLKFELFDALQNVEIPNEEILSGEIEKARIRDEINDWIKGILLKEQTKTELLQRNKMIALLTKKLHDNETDGELDDNEINDETKKEILKFLYKLPLTVNDNKIVGNYADKLIDNLNRSASSRRYNASKTLRSLKDTSLSLWKTIDNSTDDTKDKITTKSLNIGTVTEKYTKESTSLNESTKDRSSKQARSNYIPLIPQSTLSTADRAHLEEIRERTLNASSFRPNSTKRDAAVSPLPTDVASQTDIIPTTSQNGIKSPNCLTKLPVCPEAKCPSRLVGFTNPVDQPFKSISPMQQDVSIDNTEIGGSQEIRTTTPDQPEICSGAIFNKEQNKQIEKGSEFQQQTDLPGFITTGSQVEFVRSITEDINPTHGNLCPGVQNISECYNKTCPSIEGFLQESNKNVGSTQEISYGQNAAAGPSKPDISPQVIMKEYYLGPSDQGTNRPGRSCISINSRGDQTRAQQGRFSHRQYNEEYASRPTQTSCSNVDCRRNFRPKYWQYPQLIAKTSANDFDFYGPSDSKALNKQFLA
ncbi:hypothetical protein K1T71_014063 [Dendrolimus kikuchii]|uniref:Uncharacterized protein n=1 Tax=Dendrolimus kikuchii TaxID=765133 RepID=A0ACC1CEV6_9NEOP|nr:hypothetical protein K1T71_014063 [Dendrolimus kikuchii]